MKIPMRSGPCEQCGLTVIVDVSRNQIAHAEPVCVAFEWLMAANRAGPGVEAVRAPFGGPLVPVKR
jgi:hypothetical protein